MGKGQLIFGRRAHKGWFHNEISENREYVDIEKDGLERSMAAELRARLLDREKIPAQRKGKMTTRDTKGIVMGKNETQLYRGGEGGGGGGRGSSDEKRGGGQTPVQLERVKGAWGIRQAKTFFKKCLASVGKLREENRNWIVFPRKDRATSTTRRKNHW